MAESSGRACLAGSRRLDWREVEASDERMAWESLVTGGVMRDMAMDLKEIGEEETRGDEDGDEDGGEDGDGDGDEEDTLAVMRRKGEGEGEGEGGRGFERQVRRGAGAGDYRYIQYLIGVLPLGI